MCYYYNYLLFPISSRKVTHYFRTINELPLFFAFSALKTVQSYIFVPVCQGRNSSYLLLFNNRWIFIEHPSSHTALDFYLKRFSISSSVSMETIVLPSGVRLDLAQVKRLAIR